MTLSLRNLSRLVRAGCGLLGTYMVLFFGRLCMGGPCHEFNDLLSIDCVVLLLAGTCGLLAGAIALLYFAGWLKITCPLCGASGTLAGAGGYTSFKCPNCRTIHGRGFLRETYYAEPPKAERQ